jgi:hypothetical protein
LGSALQLQADLDDTGDGVRVMALFGTNLPVGTEVVFLLYPAPSLGGGAIAFISAQVSTSPGSSNESQCLVTLSEPVVAQSVAISIFASAGSPPPVEYYDVGELWCGRGFVPERGIRFDTEVGITDTTEQLVSVGQQVYATERRPARAYALDFPALTEEELFGSPTATGLNLWDIYRERGKRLPVVAAMLGSAVEANGGTQVTVPAARDYLVQRLSALTMMTGDLRKRPVTRDRVSRMWSGSLTFRERL